MQEEKSFFLTFVLDRGGVVTRPNITVANPNLYRFNGNIISISVAGPREHGGGGGMAALCVSLSSRQTKRWACVLDRLSQFYNGKIKSKVKHVMVM